MTLNFNPLNKNNFDIEQALNYQFDKVWNRDVAVESTI